jgi:Copper type II ascorbate-dependent monooxygenase, C-terminal domain
MKTFALLLFSGVALFAGDATNITFYRDVLPVLQNHCQSCHRPGEVGPMALGSYDQARPWAKAIKQAVLLKKMPPWYSDAPPGRFQNDPRLSQQEIAKLTAWADNGAPAGNPQDAPRPMQFVDGWSIDHPDQIFDVPTPFQIPATGTLEYTYVIVPTGFTEDRWVTQAEVRPGNRAVVHHANVYIREPGSTWLRDYPMGKLFVPEERGQRVGSGGSSSAGASVREQVIAGYTPGRPAKQVPDGYAMLIPAGSDLVFQLHYTTNGTATTDVTRIGFVYAKRTPLKRVIRVQASNAGFVIPPGAADYPVAGSAALGVECELLNVYPHMHLRGKSMTLSAVYPTGEREEFVRVPHYEFNWQLVYALNKPRILPKGTVLKADATFDNSANNRFNPDPKATVRWGDQSWDEMMVGFFDLAIPIKTDPGRVLVAQ